MYIDCFIMTLKPFHAKNCIDFLIVNNILKYIIIIIIIIIIQISHFSALAGKYSPILGWVVLRVI
jgi:hypothetical protein